MDARLTDQIYECSFVPESWRRVLADLAALAQARAGFLFVSNNDIHHWTSSTEAGLEALEPLVKSGWVARSDRFRRMHAAKHPGFAEQDVSSPDEMKQDHFFIGTFCFHEDWALCSWNHDSAPTGDTFSISLERKPVQDELPL